jgi:hypothetical protein
VARKNFDIRKTSQEHKEGSSSGTIGSVAEKPAHICYEPQLLPEGEKREKPKRRFARRYRVGGTSLINLSQTINLKAAVLCGSVVVALPS